MTSWLRGKRGGAVAFLAIAALLTGGLGWATRSVLRLEQEQLAARAEAEHKDRLRLALWRLDSFLFPELAREASRPFNHYSAVYAPWPVFNHRLQPLAGGVLELSPLLQEELPDWVALHFCAGGKAGWWSPQVLSDALKKRLQVLDPTHAFRNVTPEREQAFRRFAAAVPADALLALAEQHGRRLPAEPSPSGGKGIQLAEGKQGGEYESPEYQDFKNRSGRTAYQGTRFTPPLFNNASALDLFARNGEKLLAGNFPAVTSQPVQTGLMTAVWLPAEAGADRLVFARPLTIGGQCLVQGVVLNWPRLQQILAAEIADLFPGVTFRPNRQEFVTAPERTMTALPVEVVVGPPTAALPEGEWTPLRLGLAVAWGATLVALLAVALGGWSLIDFGERRLRFVSAVTHEVRTPLTTLRLYLDMLLGGLVRDPQQKQEYLQTLTAETDRLHRLISNVLDFSRLENARPRVEKKPTSVAGLLDGVRDAWQQRCREAGKELLVDNRCPPPTAVLTDARLVGQILGNLIDNSSKYSRGAADPRILIRTGLEKSGRVVIEVEDFGPGVGRAERRAVFQAFRRGRRTEMSAEGVGLGLALARRWARLLGGRLTLRRGPGACFRLDLPAAP